MLHVAQGLLWSDSTGFTTLQELLHCAVKRKGLIFQTDPHKSVYLSNSSRQDKGLISVLHPAPGRPTPLSCHLTICHRLKCAAC